MGSPGRRTGPSIRDLLFETSTEFEFSQAVRLLQRVFNSKDPVGGFAHPSGEAIRFYGEHSFACPSSMVRRLERNSPFGGQSQIPAHMKVAGFELTGYCGVLPYFYLRL